MDQDAFDEVYRDGRWGFGSGHGSLPQATADYRSFLEDFIRANQIHRVLDFGCGDWQFSRLIDWQGASYIGVDIVPSLIDRNQNVYGTPQIQFMVTPQNPLALPNADLLICKDVLQHLPNSSVQAFLDDVVPRFKLALIINDAAANPAELNVDIEAAQWRPLDIRLPPFCSDAVVIKTLSIPQVRARRWRTRGQFNAAIKPVMLLRGGKPSVGRIAPIAPSA